MLVSEKQLISIIGGLLMVLGGVIYDTQRDIRADLNKIAAANAKNYSLISWLSGKMGDSLP